MAHKSVAQIHNRLTRLSRKLNAIEFRDRDDEENTLGDRLGKAAAVVGGGAALYGGASYLRGRMGVKPGDSANRVAPGLAGIAANVKAGHAANVADIKSALSGVKSSVVAGYGKAGQAATQAVRAAGPVAGTVKQSAVNAGRSVARTATGATSAVTNAASNAVNATKSALWRRARSSKFPLAVVK